MNISYEEIGYLAVTFPASGCQAGQVCVMGSTGKVGPCAAGGRITGLVESVNGGQAAVQIHGFVTVPYTGTTAPATGYAGLSADGSGGVKADASGVAYLVVAVDTAATTVTFEL